MLNKVIKAVSCGGLVQGVCLGEFGKYIYYNQNVLVSPLSFRQGAIDIYSIQIFRFFGEYGYEWAAKLPVWKLRTLAQITAVQNFSHVLA
jgi:hypothetical protein